MMYKVFSVDVRLNGEDSPPYSNITPYVQSAHWELGRRRWGVMEDDAHAVVKIRVGRREAGYMYPLDFGRLRPGLLMRICYSVPAAVSPEAYFTGYIESIEWQDGLMVVRLVTLLELLKGQLIEFDLLTDADTGEIVETVLEAARYAATRDYLVINVGWIGSGWISDASLDLDAEMSRDFVIGSAQVSHPYVGDQSQYLVDAWQILQEAVEAENGLLVSLRNGNPWFAARNWADERYSDFSYQIPRPMDQVSSCQFDYGDEIITRASCTYYSKYLQTSTTLWSLGEKVEVPIGGSAEIKAVFSDDVNQIVGAENAALGSFVANYFEDGTGIDASGALSVTKVDESSTTMTIRFTNTDTVGTLWVQSGTVTGDRVAIGSPNSVEVVDDNAELAYGVKALRMRNSIIGRAGDAQRMLQRFIYRPARGLGLKSVTFNGALLTSISDTLEDFYMNYIVNGDIKFETSMPGMPDTAFKYVISREIHDLERVAGRLGNHVFTYELEKANNDGLDDS